MICHPQKLPHSSSRQISCGSSFLEVRGLSVNLQSQSLVPLPLLSHLLFAVLEGTPQPPAVPRAHPDCSRANTPVYAITRPVMKGPGWAHVTSVPPNEVQRNGFLSGGCQKQHVASTWERQWRHRRVGGQEGGGAEHRGFGVRLALPLTDGVTLDT